jgi:hypothetical protein
MVMASKELIAKGLDSDIFAVHQRFLAAMETRLPSMPLETKERYFAVLAALVGKLETAEKPLPLILQEMMTEAGAIILQELSAR